MRVPRIVPGGPSARDPALRGLLAGGGKPRAQTLRLALVCALIAASELLLFVRFRERYSPARIWQYAHVPESVALAVLLAVVAGTRCYQLPLLLVFLVIQHVYFGGWTHFPQMLVHGRLSWELCVSDDRASLSTFVLTGGDPARLASVRDHLRGLDYQLVAGVPSTREEGNGAAYRRLLERARDNATAEWVLLLEDDARLHWDFVHQLRCEMARPELDLVWLDARADIGKGVTGAFDYCSTGMLARRRAIPAILSRLGPGASFHREFRARRPELMFLTDPLLAEICNTGVLRCSARPLVSEAGFASMPIA
jgi:hypothetical protein